jgi:hypothetical protein
VLRRPSVQNVSQTPGSSCAIDEHVRLKASASCSNELIDKIVLSDDSLMAIFDGFHAVLVLRTAWWQAPDNLVRA